MTAPPDPYRAEWRAPTAAELRALHEAVGWDDDLPDDDDVLVRGLTASLFGVVVTAGAETVACARIVGDGALYFYVQDIAVLPGHQGRGIGAFLMDEVMRFLAGAARPKAFVGLFAASGKGPFYERYGFCSRGSNEPGMALEWPAR